MTRVKTSIKLLIMLGLALLTICIFNTKVNAYSKENIKVDNEIEQGLIDNVYSSNWGCSLSLNANKIISLLSNNSKLNSLVKSDNLVYENVYFKLLDNATKVTVTIPNFEVTGYDNEGMVLGTKDTTVEKELEIVTIDNVKYAKCPVGLFIKSNEGYTLTGMTMGISICGITVNGYKYATINMQNDTELVEKFNFSYGTSEDGPVSHLYLYSKSKDIMQGGHGGGDWQETFYHRPELATLDDLYVAFGTDTNVGNSINIEPFGTLTLSNTNNSEYKYLYEAQIKDKTVLNKEYTGQIVMSQYNLLHFYSITYTGDLIKEEPKVEEPTTITTTDTTTKIKLDTTTNVVPEGTKLVAEEVKSGDNYNTVVKAVENDVEKFVLYDISLVNNNATIQPNGKVKVSIPVPTGYDTSKIVVFRVSDDGTKTKYDTTIKEGYITFETDHFSNYVVAEEKAKETTTTNNEETSTKTETTNTTKRELDNTPKTGEETNVVTVISSVLSLLSMVGIAIVRRF